MLVQAPFWGAREDKREKSKGSQGSKILRNEVGFQLTAPQLCASWTKASTEVTLP
jgi:hypothetical protein